MRTLPTSQALADEPPCIEDVVQESLVKVDEEGVEAAAVTSVTMVRMSFSPTKKRILNLAFDRPFACAVMDASGTVPLFAGYQAAVPGA
ncbi:serpin family protein [Yinghuangia aomiensis]